MWRAGYVDIVNLRSHMPNMNEDTLANVRSEIRHRWWTFMNGWRSGIQAELPVIQNHIVCTSKYVRSTEYYRTEQRVLDEIDERSHFSHWDLASIFSLLSSRGARELCGGTSFPHRLRPRPNPSETNKADIVRGGDFHGVDESLNSTTINLQNLHVPTWYETYILV